MASRKERDIQQDENQAERQRDDDHQALLGLLHFLELAAPDRVVRGLEELRCAVLGLCHGAGQVAAADAELDRDQPLSLFAIDRRRAGPHELAVGVGRAVVADGRTRSRSRSRGVLLSGLAVLAVVPMSDGLARPLPMAEGTTPGPGFCTTVLLPTSTGISRIRLRCCGASRPAHRDVEDLFAFDHLREGCAAQGGRTTLLTSAAARPSAGISWDRRGTPGATGRGCGRCRRPPCRARAARCSCLVARPPSCRDRGRRS